MGCFALASWEFLNLNNFSGFFFGGRIFPKSHHHLLNRAEFPTPNPVFVGSKFSICRKRFSYGTLPRSCFFTAASSGSRFSGPRPFEEHLGDEDPRTWGVNIHSFGLPTLGDTYNERVPKKPPRKSKPIQRNTIFFRTPESTPDGFFFFSGIPNNFLEMIR